MGRLASTLGLWIGLLAFAGVSWWLITREPEVEPAAPPPPYVLPVTLGVVELGRLEPSVQLSGTVSTSRRSRVGFTVGGLLAELAVEEGARVAAGAPLGRLVDADQRVDLARAEAALALSRREFELADAGTRAEILARLAAELEQRRADEDLAQSEVERNRPLAGTDVITASRIDLLEAQLSAARARVRAAEATLAEARAGTRAEQLAVQEAQVDLRAAEVAQARRELDKTLLSAPFDAYVIERLASVGETLNAGEPVLELVDLGSREIRIEVPARYAEGLAEAAPVALTKDEAPGFRLETELDAVIVQADPASRNFRALARLDPDEDPALVLKPGAFVRVELALRPLERALLVPADAVRVVESGDVVVRAQDVPGEAGRPPGLTAEWVPVRVLGEAGGRAAVEPLGVELSAGDRLVLVGLDLAFPGVPLLPSGAATGAPPSGAGEEPQ